MPKGIGYGKKGSYTIIKKSAKKGSKKAPKKGKRY